MITLYSREVEDRRKKGPAVGLPPGPTPLVFQPWLAPPEFA